MYARVRCGHCTSSEDRKKQRPKFRRRFRKIKDFPAFLEEVKKGLPDMMFITREGIASKHKVSLNTASKAVHELIKLGVLSSEVRNRPLHDSDRDNGGGHSGWIASHYSLRTKDDQE